MNWKTVLFLLCFPLAVYAQANLEEHFNLCLVFGAPLDVVQLFQPFRGAMEEVNGTLTYVARQDNSLLRDTPYSQYQIWYTMDKELGLYQSSLFIWGEGPALQSILTTYLRRFNQLFGDPEYTYLDNDSRLIFWYDEDTFTVKARLILDNVNKFVSVTFSSPLTRHEQLLRSLYSGMEEDKPDNE